MMAESMIERVARAICAKDPNDYEWDWLTEGGKAHFLDAARAAIEAMREPTEDMHEAAEEISVYYDDFSCGDGNVTLGLSGYREKFNGIWSQLIDAALKEDAR